MKIRLAQSRDAADIASIHVKVWKTAYRDILDDVYLSDLSDVDRETGWNERLKDNSIITLLAEEDGNSVGFVAAGKSRDADDSPSMAEIYAIYIDRTYSRRGFGSALLQQIVEHLMQLGFKEVMLWVLDKNASARAFYTKQEMQVQPNKTRQIAIGEQKQTEVRYRLSIATE